MAGFIEFKDLRHFKDGENCSYQIELTGGSILEYRSATIEGEWSISLPLLGRFLCNTENLSPSGIDIHAHYMVILNENNRTATFLKRPDYSDYRNE